MDWNNALLWMILIMLVLNLATSLEIMYKLIQHDNYLTMTVNFYARHRKKECEPDKKTIKINLNETVKVKLTDFGRAIYRQSCDRLNGIIGEEFFKVLFA